MSQPPVPLPRRLRGHAKSVNDEMLKCGSSPQSPTSCSEVNLKQRRNSTPPLVLPRTLVRQDAVINEYEEILKVEKPSGIDKVEARPPPLPAKPPKKQLSEITKTLSVTSLSDSYEAMTPWTDVCRDLQLRGEPEAAVINVKAELLYKAIQEYNQLVCEHGGTLKELINELQGIALNLDKVSKGTKIAGITGGASTVAGGVAAAAGVILCPFTAGASLALTAVGVGVAAAGGVTGASAAIAHKANLTQDKKKIDKTLQDFDDRYGKILSCLKYINEGMEQLKQHGLSVLNTTERYSLNVAKIVKLATGDASAMSSETSSKASGVIKGFALGMDFYFVEGKDGLKLKKGLESKLAKKLRKLAEDLEKGLNELMQIKDVFSKID